jgi:hypothetical protein
MSMEDKFHVKEVDSQELLQVLLSYFGHAEGNKPRGYRYKKTEKDFFLDVQLGKTGKIVEISLSRDFPGEELSKIESKIKETLIDNQNPRIGQVVGFSSERVGGYFRYKDLFQIIPVPDNAPKPEILVADHPFLLQFSYTSCPYIAIDNIRRSHKSNVYIRLLNLFSNLPITLGSRSVRFSWIMETKDSSNWTSKWRQEGYTYKGFSGKIDEYDPVDNLTQIKRIPYQEYYSAFPGITSEPLKFPDDLEKSFDLALGLNKQDWKKFFMACSWYYQAGSIWQDSNSSAYIALVNAIECLIEDGIERCKYCGQPKYSVTKKFKEFLEEHVPFLKERFPKEASLLYQVRSKLSHGLDLLMRDLEPWNFMMNVKAQEQDFLQRNLSFITRIAICNWLKKRSQSRVV